MGNQFIGFPVPRAKIADMIAGEAAPKDHHADHEHGGSDEVDCTGLAGAGGGIKLNEFTWNTCFESIDALDVTKYSSESLTLSTGHIEIRTIVDANSYIQVSKTEIWENPDLTWAKERILKTAIQLYSPNNKNGDIFLGLGDWGAWDNLIAFRMQNGQLKGYINKEHTESEVNLIDEYVGAYTLAAKLEFQHYPGDRVEFYVDGTLRGTISGSGSVPSGTVSADRIFGCYNRAQDASNYLRLQLSRWKVWQAD